jgi:hypothetical protein
LDSCAYATEDDRRAAALYILRTGELLEIEGGTRSMRCANAMPLHEAKLTMRAETLLGRANAAARQAEIWAKVREAQEHLSRSVGASMATTSPSSLQLSLLEHKRCLGCRKFLARTNKLLVCANNFWPLDFTSKLAMWLSPEDPTIWPLHRAQHRQQPVGAARMNNGASRVGLMLSPSCLTGQVGRKGMRSLRQRVKRASQKDGVPRARANAAITAKGRFAITSNGILINAPASRTGLPRAWSTFYQNFLKKSPAAHHRFHQRFDRSPLCTASQKKTMN